MVESLLEQKKRDAYTTIKLNEYVAECKQMAPEFDFRVDSRVREIITTEGTGYVYRPEDEEGMHL